MMLGIRAKTQNVFKVIKGFTQSANQRSKNVIVKFETKVQGTMVENWLKYWKTVYKDYRDVVFDVGKDIKQKPTKAILIFSGFSMVTYCAQNNPDAKHFRNAFVKAYNDVILVNPNLQRLESVDHLHFIEECYNSNILKHLDLGIFSVIWTDNYSPTCNMYEAQCSYLQLQYSKFTERIVDVGFLDTWWILAKKMTDYDINY